MQFNNTPLVIKQNNYVKKVLNIWNVNDLDNLSKVSLNKFKLKNFLFGSINIVKNSDKSKYICSDYGIAFDGASSGSFGNEFDKKNLIFGVDKVHYLVQIIARITFSC